MRVLLVSFIIVIVDQVSKILVKGFSIPFLNFEHVGLAQGNSIHLIGDFFNLTFVENPGIAFGITFGADYKLFISFLTIAASIALFFYLYINRKKSFVTRFSIALILGGAFGNLIDRIFYGVFYGYAPLFYGRVVDFFDFHLFNFFMFHQYFGSYVFNIADVSVTAGVILLVYALNKEKVSQTSVVAATENILIDNKE